MAGRVDSKVAIVTGAARGLGRSHCIVLAREGADIVAVDIASPASQTNYKMADEDELNTTVKEVKALGRKAIAVKCDVTKAADVQNMVDVAIQEFGKIDILVNNAGIIRIGAISYEMPEELWDLIVDVNLKGTFLCCKYVVPHMIKQGSGKIINTGSTAGRQESAAGNAYGAAKAAVHGFTHVLAAELAPYKINVNCVAPGNVDTAQRKSGSAVFAHRFGVAEKDTYQRQLEVNTLLKQVVTAEDVSNTVLFLATEESRNIDGMVIYVDGGHPG